MIWFHRICRHGQMQENVWPLEPETHFSFGWFLVSVKVHFKRSRRLHDDFLLTFVILVLIIYFICESFCQIWEKKMSEEKNKSLWCDLRGIYLHAWRRRAWWDILIKLRAGTGFPLCFPRTKENRCRELWLQKHRETPHHHPHQMEPDWTWKPADRDGTAERTAWWQMMNGAERCVCVFLYCCQSGDCQHFCTHRLIFSKERNSSFSGLCGSKLHQLNVCWSKKQEHIYMWGQVFKSSLFIFNSLTHRITHSVAAFSASLCISWVFTTTKHRISTWSCFPRTHCINSYDSSDNVNSGTESPEFTSPSPSSDLLSESSSF